MNFRQQTEWNLSGLLQTLKLLFWPYFRILGVCCENTDTFICLEPRLFYSAQLVPVLLMAKTHERVHDFRWSCSFGGSLFDPVCLIMAVTSHNEVDCTGLVPLITLFPCWWEAWKAFDWPDRRTKWLCKRPLEGDAPLTDRVLPSPVIYFNFTQVFYWDARKAFLNSDDSPALASGVLSCYFRDHYLGQHCDDGNVDDWDFARVKFGSHILIRASLRWRFHSVR